MQKLTFLALLFIACNPRPEDLQTLDFFTVEVEGHVFIELSKITLRGRVEGLGQGVSVERCGFVCSNDLNALQEVTLKKAESLPNVRSIEVTPVPTGNGPFSTVFTDFDATGRIFYAAFAQLGERKMFSVVKSYSEGGIVAAGSAPVLVKNDTAWVTGQLFGLAALKATVEEFGHVFSKNPDPRFGKPNCTPINLGVSNDDRFFTTKLTDLDFNTTYYARAYARNAGKIWHSPTVQIIEVRDGWEPLADFPGKAQGGIFAESEQHGKAFFGFYSDATEPVYPQDYLRNLWSFQPGGNVWEPLAPYEDFLPSHNNCFFVIGDTLYALFGQSLEPGIPYWTMLNRFCKYHIPTDKWFACKFLPTALGLRTLATAFVLDGIAYVGAGVDYVPGGGVTYFKDFWAYNPKNGVWQKMADLPGMPRRDAIAFSFAGGTAIVGGGNYNEVVYLTDFWKFTPPQTSGGMGQWTKAADFPAPGREVAVAFVLDGKGYYGLGSAANVGVFDDFWEYDPLADRWERRTDFPGGNTAQAAGFALGGYGFAGTGIQYKLNATGTGVDKVIKKDFWRYVPRR